MFGIGQISDATLAVSATSDHPAYGSIDIVQNRWFVDFANNNAIYFLPYMIDVNIYSTVHEKSLAVGTPGGRVFTVHFPPALFTSWEYRVIKGKGRPIV
jgi:hypothetical protein